MNAALRLARGWYVLVGSGSLLATVGHLTGGSRIDGVIVGIGLGVGLFALGAAVWVLSGDAVRAVVAWLGIVVVPGGFLYALWLAATTAGTDAVIFIGVPTALAVAAAAVMAVGRARTPNR
jgi:hypothetical protein